MVSYTGSTLSYLGAYKHRQGAKQMSKRTSLGRQKIEIAKIDNKNRLQVTFSKRRTGLFKKASELCTLCGVEIAILVFSPTNKVFSFGHPDVNSIIDRFIGSDSSSSSTKSAALKMLESYSRNDNIRHLNMMLAQLYAQLEEERDRSKNLDNIIKARQQSPPFDDLNHLKMSLHELKKKVMNNTRIDSSFLPQLHNPRPTTNPPAADHSLTIHLPKPTKHDDIDTAGNISHFINFPPQNNFFPSL